MQFPDRFFPDKTFLGQNVSQTVIFPRTDDDNVRCVQDMIQKDRRLNIRYVADSLKMSYGATRHIITDVLGYHAQSVRSMGATNVDA